MNSLSWMIYLADVAENIGFVCGLMLILGLAAGGICVLFWDDIENGKRLIKPYLITMAVVMFVGTVVPSKEAIYAMAASESGEKILKSETGDKAIQALNAWLDRQIKGEPKA
jgi:hypothetical protein